MKLKSVCPSGKKKYGDKATAQIVAKTDRKRTRQWITPYPCIKCGWWHVGHPPNPKHPGVIGRIGDR